MTKLKAWMGLGLALILSACSNTPPDFTGEWEQIIDNKTAKRFLIISQENNQYRVLDEIRDMASGKVAYDEASQGVLDGDQLLTGTNLLTNVLSYNKDSQELSMKTHEQTTLIFKKNN